MTRTIKEIVNSEIYTCASSLIYSLTEEKKLDTDIISELWGGKIDWEAAKYELEANQDSIFKLFSKEDNKYYFGVKNSHGSWKVDPIYDDEESAVYEWFEMYRGGDLSDYCHEIYEHWIVSEWLGKKLIEQNETVVDFYDLTIWCRSTTGQSIELDEVIQSIHSNIA